MNFQSSELMISNRNMLEIAQGRSKLSLDLPDSDANHNAAVSHNHPSNYNNRKTGKTRPLLHINWKVAMIKFHQRQLLLFILDASSSLEQWSGFNRAGLAGSFSSRTLGGHGVPLLFVSCCVETIANIYNTFDGVVTLWAFNFGAKRGQHDYIRLNQRVSRPRRQWPMSGGWWWWAHSSSAESWSWAFRQWSLQAINFVSCVVSSLLLWSVVVASLNSLRAVGGEYKVKGGDWWMRQTGRTSRKEIERSLTGVHCRLVLFCLCSVGVERTKWPKKRESKAR